MIYNKLKEVDVVPNNPFANDKLDRKGCANTLIAMTEMYAHSGCVISLNGDWGTGKTTFVRMTMQEMINQGFKPLYFNAWENDYVEDPLIALLSEMKELAPSSDKWDKVVANGGKIMASVGASVFKSILKNKFGSPAKPCVYPKIMDSL